MDSFERVVIGAGLFAAFALIMLVCGLANAHRRNTYSRTGL